MNFYQLPNRTIQLTLTILLITLLVPAVALAAPVSAPNQQATTPATVEPRDARQFTLQVEDGRLTFGKGKLTMGSSTFLFDPEQKLAGAPGGMMMTMEDSPPIIIMSMSSSATGSAYMDYANVVLNLNDLLAKNYTQPINIANQYTTDGVERCSIKLIVASRKEIFISSDYVVFGDGSRVIADSGPFVKLAFQPVSQIEGTLVVQRRDKEIGRVSLSAGKSANFALEGTKSEDDVLRWHVEDQQKKIIYQGIFGFPMSGATPGLVEYWINIGADNDTTSEQAEAGATATSVPATATDTRPIATPSPISTATRTQRPTRTPRPTRTSTSVPATTTDDLTVNLTVTTFTGAEELGLEFVLQPGQYISGSQVEKLLNVGVLRLILPDGTEMMFEQVPASPSPNKVNEIWMLSGVVVSRSPPPPGTLPLNSMSFENISEVTSGAGIRIPLAELLEGMLNATKGVYQVFWQSGVLQTKRATFQWDGATIKVVEAGLNTTKTLETATPVPSLSSVTGIVNRDANLRAGPGTNYAVVGGTKKGTQIKIIGRNTAGDWVQLETGEWIAAFLINSNAQNIPIVAPNGESTLTPAATATPEATQTVSISAQQYLDQGKQYATQGDFSIAIAQYDEAIRLNPKFALAYGWRGNAYFNLGNFAQARADYTKAIQLEPDNANGYYARGTANYQLGSFSKSLEDFNQAIDYKPDYVEAYNERGLVQQALEDSDAALADYETAIHLNPAYFYAYNNRGTIYEQQGELEKARLDYDKAIQLNPDFVVAYRNRGLVYQQLGNLNAALDDFNKAIELDPFYADAYNDRGNIYLDQGDLDAALADYDQALLLDPSYYHAYRNRGLVRAAQGNYGAAINQYNKALEIYPDFADAYLSRAVAHLAQNALEDSSADFEQFLKLNPGNGDAYNSVCWNYALYNQPQLALPYCQQAIDIAPQPYIYDSRGLVYALMGDYDAAIKDFEIFVSWLEEQNDTQSSIVLQRRQSWIMTLKQGKNPFTFEVLNELRSE